MAWNNLEQIIGTATLATFGESVTYHRAGQAARTISAIVDRDPRALIGGNRLGQLFLIHVKPDDTTGIDPLLASPDGLDSVTLTKTSGSTQTITLKLFLPGPDTQRTYDGAHVTFELR